MCFPLRIKIPIVDLFGGCSDEFRIKMHLTVENTLNAKSNISLIPANAIAESGIYKTLFDGPRDL